MRARRNPVSRAAARLAQPARRRPGIEESLVLAVLAAGVLSLLLFVPGWRLTQMRVFDLLSTTAPMQPPEWGAVIVAVDEPSLTAIDHPWPWPRDVHGRLVRSLRAAGAQVIAFDIVFAEPSTPEADRALAASVGPDVILAGEVTLVESPQAQQLLRVEPLPAFLEAGAAAGIASVALDGDGGLRRMPPFPGGFAAHMLSHAAGGAAPARSPPGALIQYFGPARTYPTISYHQALEPDRLLPPEFLRDRTAIVGLSLETAPKIGSGATDAFVTPYSASTGRLISGAEVQATILDNLKHRLFILPAPLWAELLALLAAALGAAAIMRGSLTWSRGIAATLLAAGLVAASWVLLRYGRIWLSPALPAMAAVTVASAQGLRDYARERHMRHTVSRAFGQYVSPALVRRLARDPSALRLGGERRTLTIMFCDVRGFTALAERMKDDPVALTRLLNRLFSPLSEAILAANGTIDKYIGDSVMAFWNAPIADPDHACNAVAAALAMLEAVERLNGRAAAGADRFAVGIGLNTGDCVVGNMGSEARFVYSALGDAVNLASRLESASKRYDVPLVIGPETEAAARARFVTVELDRIAVKGRSAAVAIYTVLAPRDGMAGRDISALQAAHDEMLRLYRAGDWNAAERQIGRCRLLLPELEGYYGVIGDRIAAFRTDPPPEGWDGTFEASEK